MFFGFYKRIIGKDNFLFKKLSRWLGLYKKLFIIDFCLCETLWGTS